MKKIILSFFGAFVAFAAMAQPTFVSTTPANKNVVLEEYTGTNCTWCPAGHKNANDFSAANPGRVVLINIHQGSFAGSNPNYKTSFGDALASQVGITGYPTGTINRRVFSGGKTEVPYTQWAAKGPIVLAEPSFVNVDATATIDAATRVLTVVVEAYYTDTAETAFNMLNVALLQNNVVGPQVGADKNPTQITPDGKYFHGHMLRHLLTGQWGDTITADGTNNIPQGHFYTKTFTYTLPADINSVSLELGDLDIAVFVTKDKQLIYTGTKVEPTYTNLTPIAAAISSSSATPEFGCNNLASPKLVIKNMGQDIITTMSIGYKSGTDAQQTYNWTGSLPTFSKSSEIVLPQVPVTIGTATNVDLEILSINGVAQTGLTQTFNVTKPILPEAKGNARLELKIDAYGSEVTWKIKDLAGTIVAQGGPYTDSLAANGQPIVATRLITKNLNLPAVGCYTFEILDEYGDGINAGAGIGGYKIYDNDNTILVNSNGKYGDGEKRDINLTTLVGLESVSGAISSANVYPNPAKDRATLSVSMQEGTNAVISVVDVMGRTVIDLGTKSMGVGENTFEINTQDLSNGMYFVKIATDNGITTKKFNVAK